MHFRKTPFKIDVRNYSAADIRRNQARYAAKRRVRNDKTIRIPGNAKKGRTSHYIRTRASRPGKGSRIDVDMKKLDSYAYRNYLGYPEKIAYLNSQYPKSRVYK